MWWLCLISGAPRWKKSHMGQGGVCVRVWGCGGGPGGQLGQAGGVHFQGTGLVGWAGPRPRRAWRCEVCGVEAGGARAVSFPVGDSSSYSGAGGRTGGQHLHFSFPPPTRRCVAQAPPPPNPAHHPHDQRQQMAAHPPPPTHQPQDFSRPSPSPNPTLVRQIPATNDQTTTAPLQTH